MLGSPSPDYHAFGGRERPRDGEATVSNQDIDGKVPPEAAAGAPAAAAGAPDTLEQQLEKEREARMLMRDRLRHTEALAAESHALRAGMAQELERVTAERDRLRTEAAAATSSTAAPGMAAAPKVASARPEPRFTPTMAPPATPHAADRPLKPPAPPSRKGPWGALAMLSVLAVAVAAFAWYKGSLPGERESQVAAAPAATTPATGDAASSAQPVAVNATPAASTALAATMPPTAAVPLPPMSPEAQVAAAPTATGPVAAAAPAATSERLRKALDGEGIASPVDVDATTGHVMVADPQADDALRQRTDLVIRAVYAGASLPEPQIEHRWLSPRRGAHEATAATDAAPAAPPVASAPATAVANTAAARHAAALRVGEHRKLKPDVSAAKAEELTPVLPAGRVTESCLQGLAGRSTLRRSNMTACMKHSCCSSAANHNSEECRAYDKAYPFTCGAG